MTPESTWQLSPQSVIADAVFHTSQRFPDFELWKWHLLKAELLYLAHDFDFGMPSLYYFFIFIDRLQFGDFRSIVFDISHLLKVVLLLFT